MKRLAETAAPTLALFALGACTVGPNFTPPPPPAASGFLRAPLPRATASSNAPLGGAQTFTLGAAPIDRWWTLFKCPALDALEDEALTRNPDLASADAALEAALETYKAQRAAQSPSADLAFNGTGARNSAVIAPPLASNASLYSLYTTQVNIAYVVDVFGGLRRQTEEAAAVAEAQKWNTQAAFVTLTANVANAALQLAGLNAQEQALTRTIAADQRTLETTRLRQRLGEAPAADLAAAQTTLEQAEVLEPPLKKSIGQEEDLLAALLGRPSADAPTLSLTLADVTLPPDLPVSLPSELVRRRPDVRAAEANLHSASAAVGVATAARFPSFTLAAAPGGAGDRLTTMFSGRDLFVSVTGGVGAPLFDGGMLRHRQKAAQALLVQSKSQYRSTVLAALQNTADALQAVVADAESDRRTARAAASAATSVRLARASYVAGETGVLPLLTAEAAEGQAAMSLAQTEGARLTDAVALFAALGGGWRQGAPQGSGSGDPAGPGSKGQTR